MRPSGTLGYYSLKGFRRAPVKRYLGLVVAATVVLMAATAYAHHSFAATYIVDKEIKIEGDLVSFMFRNPHSFVHVQAPDDKGEMQRWAIEWAAAGQLNGVTRDTLKPGDHVIITGNPGRTAEDHRIRMRSIFRPKDGWKWSGDFQ
jgi:hypothetical protein